MRKALIFLPFILLVIIITVYRNSDPLPQALKEEIRGHGNSGAFCPLPPIHTEGEPLQTLIPESMAPFKIGEYTLIPIAGYSIEGRILSKKIYTSDFASELSKVDLALGWNKFKEKEHYSKLSITQKHRWFYYKYKHGNMPATNDDEMTESMANTHTIPSNKQIAAKLKGLRNGNLVRLDGWLVQATGKDLLWTSSLSRHDTGDGACEVMYICQVTVLE